MAAKKKAALSVPPTPPKTEEQAYQRHWNFYRTAAGRKIVKEELLEFPSKDRAAIADEMEVVRKKGTTAARHVRDDIYEVRVFMDGVTYRVLFATEGFYSHVLLAVRAFNKKTQELPDHEIDLALKRLREWRSRAKTAS